jgi:hypothetical protein
MTTAYKVHHGRCARCGNEAELFSVDVVPGQQPVVRPKAANVNIGTCLSCLRSDAWAVIESTRVLPEPEAVR